MQKRKKKKRVAFTGRTVTWTRGAGDEEFERLAEVLEGTVTETWLHVKLTDGRIVRVNADRVTVVA